MNLQTNTFHDTDYSRYIVYIRHVQRVDRDRPVDRGTTFGRSHRPIGKLYVKSM
jgi:hypothetical protein